jgi:AcrR family transcriptional regulator
VSRRIPQSSSLQRLDQGRVGQKLKTRRRILGAASALVAAGKAPTVEQAADAAGVSRRTAYRYFPAQTKLLTEAALEGLRAPMEAMLAAAPSGAELDDLGARVGALIDRMQSMAIRHEGLLRTMIHQTVLEHGPRGQLRRGTRRIEWIEAAVQPLRERVRLPAYRRLVSALALCGGIEALLVLRDIRGLPQQEAIAVSRWAAQALLKQTILESETTTRSTRKRSTRTSPPSSKRP